MFAIKLLSNASNPGRKVSGRSLLISVNYATKRLSFEEKLGFPQRPKKPLSPYIHFCQQKIAEFSNVHPKLPPKEVIPKCAEQWNMIDQETKTNLMKEYREKLKKYPDELQQYYVSLTDAQRLQLETAKNDKSESKSTQKKQLRLELKKTGKPIRPVNPFGIFVKEVYSKMPVVDSGKPSEPINLKEIGKRWNQLTPEEKAPYKRKFDAADLEYRKKLAEWEKEMVRQGKANMVRPPRSILVLEESAKLSKATNPVKTTTKIK